MDRKQEKILSFLLAAIQFTHIMDFMIIMPLGPQLREVFSITPQQFGLIVSSYTISAGVCGFLFAFIIDRFDRKSVLIAIYCGFIIGTVACGLARDYEFLLGARVLAGAFGGILNALIYSIIGDVIPFKRRAGAMGVVMAGFSVAAVAGVPFGLFIAKLYTWYVPFWFLAVAGVIILVVAILFVPSMKGHLTDSGKTPVQLLQGIVTNRNQMTALLFMFLIVIGQFTVIPYIAIYLKSNVGVTETEIIYIYLLGGGITLFSNPLVGRLSDKYGKPAVFTVMALLSIIPLLFTTHIGIIPLALVLTISSLFFLFISGRMVPAMTMITSTVKPQNRGGFMSINSAIQQLSAGMAAYVGGVILSNAPNGEILNYNYVGYLAVISTVVAVYVGRKLKAVDGDY